MLQEERVVDVTPHGGVSLYLCTHWRSEILHCCASEHLLHGDHKYMSLGPQHGADSRRVT